MGSSGLLPVADDKSSLRRAAPTIPTPYTASMIFERFFSVFSRPAAVRPLRHDDFPPLPAVAPFAEATAATQSSAAGVGWAGFTIRAGGLERRDLRHAAGVAAPLERRGEPGADDLVLQLGTEQLRR